MYIDTHCHLQLTQFQIDLDAVLQNAMNANVKQCIVPGVNLYSSRLAIDLAAKKQGVIYAAIGFHPYEASSVPDIRELEGLLREKERHAHIVAIGECGLDYHLYKGESALGKKQEQRLLFAEHIRLALQYDLPLIMHCRDAFDDFFSVLNEAPPVRGVIHCFSGGLQEVREAQRRHLFLGIDGNVTYSKQLAVVVPHIPDALFLLETDAPYLTPVPHRGTRNEPQYIPLIAEKIAQLKGVDQEEIMTKTTANARSLFGLSVL